MTLHFPLFLETCVIAFTRNEKSYCSVSHLCFAISAVALLLCFAISAVALLFFFVDLLLFTRFLRQNNWEKFYLHCRFQQRIDIRGLYALFRKNNLFPQICISSFFRIRTASRENDGNVEGCHVGASSQFVMFSESLRPSSVRCTCFEGRNFHPSKRSIATCGLVTGERGL